MTNSANTLRQMEPRYKMYSVIPLIWELKISYQKKEGNIYMKYLKNWDPEHLEINEDFNDGFEDNARDEGM